MSTELELYTIQVQEIEVFITRKAVKNLHISVCPPDGKVKVTTPFFLSEDTIRNAIITRLSWIRKQNNKFQTQARQAKREMVNGETIYWLGQRYRLNINTTKSTPKVSQQRFGFIDMYVKPESTCAKRESVLYEWYREQLKIMIPELLKKWESIIGVQDIDWGIKRMKTRWGTCNPNAKRIWLNLELAKKPVNCIEYVLVHELVHLLERSHNKRFKTLMTQYMPLWSQYRAELNAAPLADESWEC